MTHIYQYIHRPNNTELGKGNTHECYLLISSGLDLSSLFPPTVNINIEDIAKKKIYTLKSSLGNEFRINQLGPIYRDYDVHEGDEIWLTKIDGDEQSRFTLRVVKHNRIIINVTKSGAIVGNLERLVDYIQPSDVYSLTVRSGTETGILNIEFEGSKKKRTDSPDTTDFYRVTFNGRSLDTHVYMLDLESKELFLFDKYHYNEVVLSGESINSITEFNSSHILSEPLQQIFYGAPGTGKSFEINRLTEREAVVRTTFHPDSDYSTFVGAYKPVAEEAEARVVPVVVATGITLEQNQGTYREKRITYKFVKQAFLKAYLGAWKKYADAGEGEAKHQYLVIEEINRGNCAQIFGDIFQLLDRQDNGFSSYPIEADTDLQQEIKRAFAEEGEYLIDNLDTEGAVGNYTSNYGKTLSEDIRCGRVLLLPPNLYIWATMNTSDQSLFPIDSAFKRRWDWKYMPIDTRKENWSIDIDGNSYSWSSFLENVNKEIFDATSSEDKQLGFYFCKAQGGVVSAEKFVGKVLFYIYNDVFKDYGFDRDFFKDKDNGGKLIAFRDYFQSDGSINKVFVARLLDNLGVEKKIKGEAES